MSKRLGPCHHVGEIHCPPQRFGLLRILLHCCHRPPKKGQKSRLALADRTATTCATWMAWERDLASKEITLNRFIHDIYNLPMLTHECCAGATRRFQTQNVPDLEFDGLKGCAELQVVVM